MSALSRVLLAGLVAVSASPAFADTGLVSAGDKTARAGNALVARNAPVADAARILPARSKVGISIARPASGDPMLGLEFADTIDPFVAAIGLTGESGALVLGVERNGAAARAGFLPGDLVVSVAGERVRDATALRWMLRDLGEEPVRAEIVRVGQGPEDLVAQLRAVAAGGNRDAMLALGDASLFNLAGGGQLAAAEDYYLRAYAMGDARAAYRLGTMYATGRGARVDLAVATKWYGLAAEAGLPAGQHALGLTWWSGRYWTGLALVGDYDEAVRLFTLAAARDYSPSYLYLGLAHQLGYGAPKDAVLAAEWFEKAIAAGNVEAMYRRAEIIESGQVPDAAPDTALELFRTAASLGSVEASRRLGEKYWRGEGVMRHPINAIAHLEAAAAQGDVTSMSLIAQILLSGYGVTRDATSAVQWYFRAFQAGDADAGYALALAYADGLGVERDTGKVAGFMLEAIRRGSVAALNEMKANAEGWDIAIREDLQRLLQASGFYTGEIDGVFGPGTLRALNAAAAAG